MSTCLDNLPSTPHPTLYFALSQYPIYLNPQKKKAPTKNHNTTQHNIISFSMPLSPSSMASIPQFYPNYTFTTHDLSEYPVPLLNGGGNASVMDSTTMWGGGQDSLSIPVLDMNNGALDHIVSLDCDTMACAANWMPSFSEQLGGLSDLAISDCKIGFYGGGFQSFNNSRSYQPHVGEFGDECCGFVEDLKPPPYPNAARENWVCFNFVVEFSYCFFDGVCSA